MNTQYRIVIRKKPKDEYEHYGFFQNVMSSELYEQITWKSMFVWLKEIVLKE